MSSERPDSRISLAANECIVEIQMSARPSSIFSLRSLSGKESMTSSMRLVMRDFISPAAASVYVSVSISFGMREESSINRRVYRSVRTHVLPVPAPAPTVIDLSSAVIASLWPCGVSEDSVYVMSNAPFVLLWEIYAYIVPE